MYTHTSLHTATISHFKLAGHALGACGHLQLRGRAHDAAGQEGHRVLRGGGGAGRYCVECRGRSLGDIVGRFVDLLKTLAGAIVWPHCDDPCVTGVARERARAVTQIPSLSFCFQQDVPRSSDRQFFDPRVAQSRPRDLQGSPKTAQRLPKGTKIDPQNDRRLVSEAQLLQRLQNTHFRRCFSCFSYRKQCANREEIS